MNKAQPMIAWPGGKRRLADTILPLIPAHQCYVEPFAGAGALYFCKEPSPVEVINDINGELINLYRVVKHHFEEFYRQFKYALSSRQVFEWHKQEVPETLTDIQRAARFFYLQKHSHSGKVPAESFGTATTGTPSFNLLRIEEDLSAVHLRLQNTYIEHLSWEKVIDKYDRAHSFFFIDPPYWQTAGYGVEFDWQQYELLKAKFDSLQGKVMVTLNAHPDILELFKGYPQDIVDIKYSMGDLQGTPKTSHEVIIRSADFRANDLFSECVQ